MACVPEAWPVSVLASFCSQYGSPDSYELVVRAKLLGTSGDIERLIDRLHVTVMQSSMKDFKKKHLKQWIPDYEPEKKHTVRGGHVTEAKKRDMDSFMGSLPKN